MTLIQRIKYRELENYKVPYGGFLFLQENAMVSRK